MKGQVTSIAIALFLVGQSEAFTSPPASALSHPQRDSRLSLVPDQANQLVAAYNANCVEKKLSPPTESKDMALIAASRIRVSKPANNNGNNHNGGAIAASKSFLARVFHMPSVKHPASEADEAKRDVVYHPMVGFRFFSGIDAVFPTKSNVSCMMPTKTQKEEEVFGWFSPSCQLDAFSDDICLNPIGSDGDECILM